MLKTLIQSQPPYQLTPLSPASLTDKPLGASEQGTKADEGGVYCVHVWVHVHKVCQQVSRGAGMSANSRSTRRTQVQDEQRHTCSHNSANPPNVDALKGATL